ncbi:hypothetical protein [Sinomicrobium weinanense]|uniref:Uncharacterized protein n=1 Tax=Sinomicrobium weinanense TaxID=2842200 RepID=A0A926Q3I4_9FLAO|nr:hypothetical protein [Sinomicrobium weinanense]MBC9797632.1 hypothetical protein [Sinomicrobium weinanense]MBU3125252.1 hypothetical protein [Sinomicrobium weinanense]
MKKRSLKSLKLNKKTISGFTPEKLKGGEDWTSPACTGSWPPECTAARPCVG